MPLAALSGLMDPEEVGIDEATGFAAGTVTKPDWSPVEKDMLATIDIEKLLAVERRTTERG
jgi:hypothetical protein